VTDKGAVSCIRTAIVKRCCEHYLLRQGFISSSFGVSGGLDDLRRGVKDQGHGFGNIALQWFV
jgi:hypothetical protein